MWGRLLYGWLGAALVAGAGCARSGFDEPPAERLARDGGLRDASGQVDVDLWPLDAAAAAYGVAVELSQARVMPGQRGVAVRVGLHNPDAAPVEVGELRLRFWRGDQETGPDFAFTAAAGNPRYVAAGEVGSFDLRVDVAAAAAPGEVQVDALLLLRRGDGQLTQAAGPEPRAAWVVDAESGLHLAELQPSLAQVFPGQSNVAVWVKLDNRGSQVARVLNAQLRFERDGRDVSDEYSVEPGPGLDRAVTPGSSLTLSLAVAVLPEAVLGSVSIDAVVEIELEGGARVVLAGAERPCAWEVVAFSGLTVSTDDDEDDTGGALTLAAAGGALDLSLREALLLLGASQHPPHIRFDPAVFPAASARRIVLDPVLGALPPIARDGASLDGRGAGVIVDGSALNPSTGLSIAASDVSLLELDLNSFAYGCLLHERGDRLLLQECNIERCGAAAGVPFAVELRSGSGHRVEGGLFSNQGAYGLTLGPSTRDVAVSGLTVRAIGNRNGISLAGSGHLLSQVDVESAGCALKAEGLQDSRIEDSRFVSGGNSSQDASGVCVGAASHGVRLEGGLAQASNRHAVWIEGLSQAVEVHRTVLILGVDGEAIGIEAGSNADAAAPVIEGFDGLQLSGSAAAESGLIEVYQPGDMWHFLDSAQVAQGRWSLQLAAPAASVAASFTSETGSTSAFSAAATPFGDDAVLWVSTAEDQLDGGVAIAHPSQAGADLSLREALHIANNRPGADVIRFDPAVFAPDRETPIWLGAGPAGAAPLPALTEAVTVDASDSGAVIDGGGDISAASPGTLVITGPDVELRGLRLRRCSGGEACVLVRGARARVRQCDIACGSVSLAAVAVTDGGTWASVSDNRLRGCRNGVAADHAFDLTVSRNRIENMISSGVFLSLVNRAQILENRAVDCSTGIHISCLTQDCAEIALVANAVASCSDAAVKIASEGNSRVRGLGIYFNTLAGCASGVSLDGVEGTRLRNNILAHNQGAGVTLGVNVGWEEDHNLFFDNAGDGVSGASAVLGWAPSQLAASDVLADPQLADLAAGDFTPGAAAVDRGVDLGYDRNGERPGDFDGAAPDIGAVEVR